MSSPDRPLAHPRRRRRLDEAQRRKQIIAGCIQVVAEHGYQQASLALIAEVAGVSKGLIWHYYSDRDTLMEQVAVTTVAQLRNQVGADIDLTAPVPAVLDAAIHRAADLGRTHPMQLRALSQIAQNLRDPDGTLHLDLAYYEETYQAQEQLFRRGQAEGSLRDFDTRVMAVTYQPGRYRRDARIPGITHRHRHRRIRRHPQQSAHRCGHDPLPRPADNQVLTFMRMNLLQASLAHARRRERRTGHPLP